MPERDPLPAPFPAPFVFRKGETIHYSIRMKWKPLLPEPQVGVFVKRRPDGSARRTGILKAGQFAIGDVLLEIEEDEVIDLDPEETREVSEEEVRLEAGRLVWKMLFDAWAAIGLSGTEHGRARAASMLEEPPGPLTFEGSERCDQ